MADRYEKALRAITALSYKHKVQLVLYFLKHGGRVPESDPTQSVGFIQSILLHPKHCAHPNLQNTDQWIPLRGIETRPGLRILLGSSGKVDSVFCVVVNVFACLKLR
jgi:hypothetical protein